VRGVKILVVLLLVFAAGLTAWAQCGTIEQARTAIVDLADVRCSPHLRCAAFLKQQQVCSVPDPVELRRCGLLRAWAIEGEGLNQSSGNPVRPDQVDTR